MTNVFSLARSVSALQVAQHQGIHLRQRGNKWWTCCPLHGEKTASLAFYDDGSYYCFGCSSGGDGIGFFAALHNLSQGEAAQQLIDAFGLDGKSPPPPSPADCLREAHSWRRKELDSLRLLINKANQRLDDLTNSAPDWETAWDMPGFTDSIRARELLVREVDTLSYISNDELLVLWRGGE